MATGKVVTSLMALRCLEKTIRFGAESGEVQRNGAVVSFLFIKKMVLLCLFSLKNGGVAVFVFNVTERNTTKIGGVLSCSLKFNCSRWESSFGMKKPVTMVQLIVEFPP